MRTDDQIQIEELPRQPETANNGGPMPDPKLQSEKHSGRGWLVISILCILVALGVWWVLHQRRAAAAKAGASARGATGPVPVIAGNVLQKDVPIYLDGLGTVQALNTVTVHVRVDGQLKRVAFVEGQDVHAGDVLAQIDPDPYQTALEQAVGKKGQDEALLANANLDMKREIDLYAAKVDSQQLYDTQRALVNQYEAAVKADQAAIDSARVTLNYATIASPIDGRTGIRQVDQGNIVHATDTGGLVVITQLKPISVVFTLPEQMLGEIHQQMKPGEELTVLAVGRDNKTLLDTGKLAVIDNQIDTTTGTLKLKATFPNDSLKLWPGEFVNARLLLSTHKNGLVVPASVVQRGPDGAYAFVISSGAGAGGKAKGQRPKPEGKAGEGSQGSPRTQGKGGDQESFGVEVRPVTVAQIEGGEALIDSGLKAGERVVVDGQYKLQTGSRVKISQAKAGKVDSDSNDLSE